MKTICDKESHHTYDIFYSELHNTDVNDVTPNITFLDNFLRENIDIFKCDYSLECKVISNY